MRNGIIQPDRAPDSGLDPLGIAFPLLFPRRVRRQECFHRLGADQPFAGEGAVQVKAAGLQTVFEGAGVDPREGDGLGEWQHLVRSANGAGEGAIWRGRGAWTSRRSGHGDSAKEGALFCTGTGVEGRVAPRLSSGLGTVGV